MTEPFTLSACAEMLWRDKPMQWRPRRLTELGFEAGIWNWQSHDLGMLGRSGATFSSMTGYISGRLADNEGAAELLATARQSIAVGKRLNVARLNLHGTGLGEGGLPVTPCEVVTGAMWLKARAPWMIFVIAVAPLYARPLSSPKKDEASEFVLDLIENNQCKYSKPVSKQVSKLRRRQRPHSACRRGLNGIDRRLGRSGRV